MTTITTEEPKFPSILTWLVAGASVISVSIFFHEIAHFAFGILSGADDVHLHATYVSYDESSVSNGWVALIAIVGPIYSFAAALAALTYMKTTGKVSPFMLIWALSPIRSLVNLVYLIAVTMITVAAAFGRTLRPITPNFDEYNFAVSLGIPPFIPALVSFLLAVYFAYAGFRLAKQHYGLRGIAYLTVAFVFGSITWMNILGPVLLP